MPPEFLENYWLYFQGVCFSTDPVRWPRFPGLLISRPVVERAGFSQKVAARIFAGGMGDVMLFG